MWEIRLWKWQSFSNQSQIIHVVLYYVPFQLPYLNTNKQLYSISMLYFIMRSNNLNCSFNQSERETKEIKDEIIAWKWLKNRFPTFVVWINVNPNNFEVMNFFHYENNVLKWKNSWRFELIIVGGGNYFWKYVVGFVLPESIRKLSKN